MREGGREDKDGWLQTRDGQNEADLLNMSHSEKAHCMNMDTMRPICMICAILNMYFVTLCTLYVRVANAMTFPFVFRMCSRRWR